MVYLITFSGYGSHVPGEEDTVSRHDNLVGSRRSPANPTLASGARAKMTHPAYDLGPEQRELVLRAMIEVCRHRDWTLLAAHIRTTHVHVVIEAEVAPERIMNALKSYSSRALNCHGCWARHGSTVYLWTRDEVANSVRYIVSKQGEPMALYTEDSIYNLGTTG
jgi:REP element-mobilizing transposase RayT